MKKVLGIAFFAGTILVAGCSSSPSPWGDMPYQESQAWSSIGVSPSSALEFRRNGFAPMDVKQWIQYGIDSPLTIINWHRAGFTAEQASKWLRKGLTLREAIDLTS
ncbi:MULTISPECIES: hypothetical protein [Pseudoalteromonas]|jgi:hypothetical protein|uniref:hypothetical protein n=1 Tax=Pseudoalteromonas TaxID=53246 RepID=UPI000EDC7D25|nr:MULTISPECIES: hypothetical protein [unclassified Pseudoalteromonas]MCF2919022.1 hypothetical protein [Pseudoalteromonas sp. APAL1]NIZ05141.1 hypothetical protein [Pseudoalteromonas sp. HF66]QWV05309.1 hypothetical protein KQ246_01710 [Pseudoalteromonas shioyasakiensis]HCV04742.1 hypothetical protein [Pseudoalteromonas sp.]|tara:strand:- start:1104 stop:1421 length:318 start_codon:yes stop_codon:yes gene_type:complete